MELRGTSWSQERTLKSSYKKVHIKFSEYSFVGENHFETGRKRKYELSYLKECVCLIELTKNWDILPRL